MPEETKETTTETTESIESTLDTEKAAEVAKEDTKTEETHTEDQAKQDEKAEEASDDKKTEEKSEDRELTIEAYGDLGLVEDEKVKVDADLQKAFKETALKHKISPEAAKEIAALQFGAVKKQVEAFTALQEEWSKACEKAYGDNLKNVQTNCGRVLTEIDKEGEFSKILTDVGYDKHPATLAFLKKVGDIILEKGSVSASATAPVKEATLEDFYNN